MFSSVPEKLKLISRQMRLDLLDMVAKNGGHVGGSLSSLDILIAIYFGKLFNLPKTYNFDSDCFVLSAGHLAPALYTVLAHYGAFDKTILSSYSQFSSPLQGHTSIEASGVLYSAGSLGQGLSFSVGLALSKPKHHILCLTSDGEHQEGQIWEAITAANKFHLSNLINIVDYNQYQIDGSTSDIMPLEDLGAKYLRFGWSVYEFDGHNYVELLKFLTKAKNQKLGPVCLIAHTTFGKGISYMHYDYKYHSVPSLNEADYLRAKTELQQL